MKCQIIDCHNKAKYVVGYNKLHICADHKQLFENAEH